MLGLQPLCENAQALDLEAFNAPHGGFVVARDLPFVQQCFREAFAQQSAADMELRLNAVGVPAARVRRLGEFLSEAASPQALGLPIREFHQGHQTVSTPGLGFRYRQAPVASDAGAPAHGADTEALLAELGYSAAQCAALRASATIA